MGVDQEEQVRAWLKKQTPATCATIYLRPALQHFPLLLSGIEGTDRVPASEVSKLVALWSLSAMLATACSITKPHEAFKLNAYGRADFLQSGILSYLPRDTLNSTQRHAFDLIRVAANYATTRPHSVPLLVASSPIPGQITFPSPNDLHEAERQRPIGDGPTNLFSMTTPIEPLATNTLSTQNAFLFETFQDGHWSFWSRWYERAMAGDPLPWDLQREVALIPDKIWEQGPEAVAERIAEIENEWRRKQAQVSADQARSLIRQAKANALQASGLQQLVQMAIDAYQPIANKLPDALEPLEQLPPILNEIANILSADQPDTEKEADLQKMLSLMAGTVSALNQKLRDANAEIGALRQAQEDASPRRLFADAFYTKAGEGAAGLLTSKVMWGGVLSVSALFLGTDAEALVSSLGECAQTVIEQNSPSEAVAPAIQLPPLQ